MNNTTLNVDNSFVLSNKKNIRFAQKIYGPILKSFLIFVFGVLFINLTGFMNLLDGSVASFIISSVSSFPILRYVWLKTTSIRMKTLIVSFWPAMVLIFLLTTDITAGSGDGEVFYFQTKYFSDQVFSQGEIWPGLSYFKQRSIIYPFCIYFYALPYYVFNDTYDAIFPFNSLLLIIASYLLYCLVYKKLNNPNLAHLSFIACLFFPGYWLHNLHVERDIVILLQLMLFLFALNEFKKKYWVLPLFSIVILFITMLGSRPEYVVVFFGIISILLITEMKNNKIIPVILFPALIGIIYIILKLDVFTPFKGSGVELNMLNSIKTLFFLPMKVFFTSVGAFPWTRLGIVDAVGHDPIHLMLHIISTVIRLMVLLGIVISILKIIKKNSTEIMHDKIWLISGGVLLFAIQFSAIGYTRYIDPAIVLFLPATLLIINKSKFLYFLGSYIMIAFAHFYYYISL